MLGPVRYEFSFLVSFDRRSRSRNQLKWKITNLLLYLLNTRKPYFLLKPFQIQVFIKQGENGVKKEAVPFSVLIVQVKHYIGNEIKLSVIILIDIDFKKTKLKLE